MLVSDGLHGNRLTVLLPVYNGMPYLPEAVASILAQSFEGFRLLVLDDGAPGSANQNCQIDSGENIHLLPATDGVGWGSSLAGGTKAPGDSTAIASTSGSSFATPAGTGTTWVAFMPDGRPGGMSAACGFGQLGSGNGGLYITNGDRDYAVVVNALGGVRLHAWDANAGAWQE